MALFPIRPVRVQPYFGYRSQTRLVVSARALQSRVPTFAPRSRIRAMRMILSQFASRELAGVRVALTLRSPVVGPAGSMIEHHAISNSEGYVHFDVPLEPQWNLPAHPEWETITLAWTNGHGSQTVETQVLAPGRNSDLAVISDIDDTIIETGITGGIRNAARNLRRVLSHLPHERIAVPGADEFYGELGRGALPMASGASTGRATTEQAITEQAITATRRPFFYVSSSPWNLFSYLVAFKRAKGLPIGPLFLRDWGLSRSTFGSASHGAHKRSAIDAIMVMYPDLKFALIGDDTQGDLPAFADIVSDYPGRVAAVFVRTVSDHPLSPEELAGKVTIEQEKVPLWLGDSFATGLDFLRTLGFAPGGETEQIVKVIEKVDGKAEPGNP